MKKATTIQIEPNTHFLSEITALKDRPPFDALNSYLSKQLNSNKLASFSNLDSLGPDLLQYLLHERIEQYGKNADLPLSFVANDAMETPEQSEQNDIKVDASHPYYETFIAQTNTIPTRCNWHDFYNGLIWLQFPKTKAFFNQTHQQEIMQHGRQTRTPVRDKLTHFDECGLVLITDQKSLQDEISEHNWEKTFIERKQQWQANVKPIIFGHALWEMLMQPFIGLTAKATVVYDPDLLEKVKHYDLCRGEHSSDVDNHLYEHIKRNDLLKKRRPWLPIPLLGIPNWSHIPQTPNFYADKAYFMPKSTRGNK